jgi:hypothetical protein
MFLEISKTKFISFFILCFFFLVYYYAYIFFSSYLWFRNIYIYMYLFEIRLYISGNEMNTCIKHRNLYIRVLVCVYE